MPITRGFFRKRPEGPEGRLPPGQYDTGSGWPVLTAEATPQLDTARWTMTVDGLVEPPTTWTWDEIHALPASTYTGDIHCVTTWSKFDVAFCGVSVDALLEPAGPRRAPVRDGALDDRLHHQPPPRGRHRRQGLGGLGLRRPAAAARARRAGAAAGAAPVLLEVGEVGHPPRADGRGPAGVLGAATATTTAATRGSSSATRATDRDRRAIDEVTPATTAWTTGRIIEKELPTPTTVRLRLHVEDRQRHRPGQHYLIRLRAPDDYTAQRSYSVASDDDDPLLEFLVEKLPGRRGLGVPRRRRRGRRRAGDARPDRSLVHLGHPHAGPLPGRRHGRRPRRRHDPRRPPARTHRPPHRGRGRPQPRRAPLRRRAEPGRRHARLHPAGHGRPAGRAADRARSSTPLLPARARLRLRVVAVRQFAESLLQECGFEPTAIRVEQFGATG